MLIDDFKVILSDDEIILKVLVDQVSQQGKGRTFNVGIDLPRMNYIELIRLEGMVDQLSGDVVALCRLTGSVMPFFRV
jgi:hypothetical protein